MEKGSYDMIIKEIRNDFGAQISNVDLSISIKKEDIKAILKAIDDFSFLIFPDQSLSDDSHLEFTKLLGTPEPNHVAQGRDGIINYFGTIGNVQPDGTVQGNNHQHTKFLTGNNMWHTDSSFRKVPSFVSIMMAYEVPEEGGETQFVSARSAYARLPDDMKEKIDPLEVIHDYVFSRSKVAEVDPKHAASLPPITQKLVRRNPNTGAKNFYIGSHAKEILGWNYDDSRLLLDELLAETVADEYVYTHTWQPGDLVIWDNRCILHRGTGYDADKYRRFMRQTRVAGSGPTLEE
jgi:alpha-ketoglutarate-dependent 2,4-dichlorophenoxyacetate dioxygenase|tara:strand:+ start:406 stop:1281 length:876 start_codon:yes stop_codon:yes gene_type:complete